MIICISLMGGASRSHAQQEKPEPIVSRKYPPAMPKGADVEVYRKVGDVELKAWIFQPRESRNAIVPPKNRAAIVFFFGGGWRAGTPGQFLPHCIYLANRGMVAITVDYRVKTRHNTSPQDCLTDAKAAIRWVRAHAERLGVDPNRIVASGGSAGGHLAAATALVPGFEPKEHADFASTPNAMALFNPAVMLAALEGRDDDLPGDKLADINQRALGKAKQISPIHFVREKLPPSIIFHGTNDEAVPFGTVELFQKMMKEKGNRCELKAYAGQPHGFFNAGRGKGSENYWKTIGQLDTFLVDLGYLNAK